MTYGSGGYSPQTVAVADVNGDGKPDLLVANSESVGVLLGNGDGTFQTAVTYPAGGWYLAIADVNGDGKLDLQVTNVESSVGVLLGNGDGTFQPVVYYASGGVQCMGLAVADVNGDGRPDLLVANLCDPTGHCSDGTLGVLLGNGDGTFQPVETYLCGGSCTSVAVADVNGDAKLNLLVATSSGTVGALLANGNGTFQAVVSYSSCGAWGNSLAAADVNWDGKLDLILACDVGSSAGVLLGNGDGTFQSVSSFAAGGTNTFSVGVADVNGDGKPDVVTANWCPSTGSCANGAVGVLINTTMQGTTTALVSSLNPSNFGQAVTFTTTVTAQSGFDKSTPTGTVSFYDGTTNIGNSNLNSSGVATLTTSTLAVGTHTMTATYNGDSNFAPSTSPVLSQVVQGAIVSLSPTSLNFGNQTVGISSTPQVVTVTNKGNINLTINLIQITGTNSGDFAQTNNCPGSVAPNGSCKIRITFTPTATGTQNAAATITDNAPDSPQSVPLTGVGVLPAVTFSPTSLTFPVQVVFTTSPVQQVTLTNSGAGVLKINHINVTSPFQQANNCPSSLVPGAKCTINVKFHPGNKGVFHGTVSVTDNAPGSPQKVPLTGTGTFVRLAPTKLNFGTQPVGTRSLAKKITLTNKGSVTVNISGVAITGTDAGDFAETNTCGKSVAPGASCFIKVTFKPLAKGKRTADVSVYDNGGGSPQQAMLVGTGT